MGGPPVLNQPRAEDGVVEEVAFRFQIGWKPEYEKVVRTTLAVLAEQGLEVLDVYR